MLCGQKKKKHSILMFVNRVFFLTTIFFYKLFNSNGAIFVYFTPAELNIRLAA